MHRLTPWIVLPAALTLAAAAVLPSRPVASQPPALKPNPDQVRFFEAEVRPLLLEKCASCHGKDSAQGGLRLDQPVTAAMAKAILERVKGEGGKPLMPQGGPPLPAAKIAALDTWEKMGAPWPTGGKPVPTKAPLWSLQPVKKPAVPAVKNAAWVRSPIDAFLLAKMEAKGLAPAPPTDKRSLLRRVTFDLTGLPPTPAEILAFVTDKAPDAYEKAVDRLLASPRYGERAARLWLDLARYADTKGYVFNEDRNYYNAYTYRTWVIAAFNDDLPYDRFVLNQLAADKLVASDDRTPLAALGFLTVGRRFLNAQPDIIDDRIDVTMRGLQGLTVACARCHDHKFDPIPTQDYYSLYSVFASSHETTPAISAKEIREPWEAHNAKVDAATRERDELLRDETKALRETVKAQAAGTATVGVPLSDALKKALQSVRENELPTGENLATIEAAFPDERRARLTALRQTLKALEDNRPTSPEFAMAMADGDPVTVHVFKRGNEGNPGDLAPRRFLRCVSGDTRPEWKDGSGRLELARAIVSPDNPLTARVFVNRIFQQHFGTGIVRTPSDFGYQGEKPTHPELLDWLAWTFSRDDRWSIKKLHRRLVLSSAYRMRSEFGEAELLKDPENRLYAHQNRRRLDLEQLRDSLMMASGKLETEVAGGKSVDLWKTPFTGRRAVYGFIERQNLPGIFKTFDFASPDATSARRFQTTVPQQALFFLNSPLAAEQARALASLPELKRLPDDAARVRALYLRLFGRVPTADEAALAAKFLAAPDGEPLRPDEGPWRYGWGTVDEAAGQVTVFTPFPHFVEATWRGGPRLPDPQIGWAMLSAGGGHPGKGNEHATVRRWVAPADGTVRIEGVLKHPSAQGDGVRAIAVHSRGGALGRWQAFHSEAATTVDSVAVRRGDTIDFAVTCGANESFDSFAWAPLVSLTPSVATAKNAPAGVRIFRAERDFSGPPETTLVPLSRWERYAQALLMTNEFFFVD
jgi:cytochrome c553